MADTSTTTRAAARRSSTISYFAARSFDLFCEGPSGFVFVADLEDDERTVLLVADLNGCEIYSGSFPMTLAGVEILEAARTAARSIVKRAAS